MESGKCEPLFRRSRAGCGPCARSSGRDRRPALARAAGGVALQERFNCFVHSFVQSVRLRDVP